MKIRLLKPYGLSPPGMMLDPDPPVAILLIQRGLAENFKDPDGDGRAEGGASGEKKAFSKPPANKLGNKLKKKLKREVNG